MSGELHCRSTNQIRLRLCEYIGRWMLYYYLTACGWSGQQWTSWPLRLTPTGNTRYAVINPTITAPCALVNHSFIHSFIYNKYEHIKCIGYCRNGTPAEFIAKARGCNNAVKPCCYYSFYSVHILYSQPKKHLFFTVRCSVTYAFSCCRLKIISYSK